MNKNTILKWLRHIYFSVFLGHVVLVHLVYQYFVGDKDFNECVLSFWKYFKNFYLPFGVSILLLHFLFLKTTPIYLYFYYHIRIKLIYATLKRYTQSYHTNFKKKAAHWLLEKLFDDYFDSLILSSFSAGRKRPVLVRRKHLIEKSFWPNWAFAIVLLFNELKIKRNHTSGTTKFHLEVDLCNQSYGIYNDVGKQFLAKNYLSEEFELRCLQKSKEIEDFLKDNNTPQEDELIIDAREMPFRWASGGILPIAVWKGKYWYVLSFRDIEPIGWNIMNGASETKDEYKNLYSLIYREFAEELVLLNREPDIDDRFTITQKLFQFPSPLPEEFPRNIKSEEFTQRHKQRRKEHDGLIIQFEDGPEIRPISTPFEVQITYYDEKRRDTSSHRVTNVIFNLNPTEFGIEVLLLSCFNMEERDYLLHGEVWEVAPALIRQPVMLLSCNYVQKIFNETNTVGDCFGRRPHLNCKYLKKIPAGEYRIFEKEISFRKRRLKILERHNETKELPEAERSRKWFEEFGRSFEMIRDSNCDITSDKLSPLTTLCPVTWKTLETICYYKLLQNKT